MTNLRLPARPSSRRHSTPPAVLCLAGVLLLPAAALAQVRDPDNTISAGERSGPLSDVSRPVSEDSGPMHGSPTIGESSVSMDSGPVSESSTRSMHSGPVSDVSRGPLARSGSLSSGAVTEGSAGAVKHDSDRPLGDRIAEPLRELGPLQDQLRERRQRAAADAAAAAAQPVGAAAPDDGAERDVADQLSEMDGAAAPAPDPAPNAAEVGAEPGDEAAADGATTSFAP